MQTIIRKITISKTKYVIGYLHDLMNLNEDEFGVYLQNNPSIKDALGSIFKAVLSQRVKGRKIRVKTHPHPEQPDRKYIYEGYEFMVNGVYAVWDSEDDAFEIEYEIQLEGSAWFEADKLKEKPTGYTRTTLRARHLVWLDGPDPMETVLELLAE